MSTSTGVVLRRNDSSAAAQQTQDESLSRLQPECFLYEVGALHRVGAARIDFEIVGHVLVHAVILPAGQSEHPVAALPLARLEDVERGEDADPEQLEGSEQ